MANDITKNKYPHVPAAFINAIAEEGTKAEAIEWLQLTWNELCWVRKMNRMADLLSVYQRKEESKKQMG